jgi:hypothetical protein
MYSSKTVDKKEILRTVSNTGSYCSSDKVGTVYLQSIRGDETVNVNKPSPVSPQLTARSVQSAQLVQVTHCIRTHVNLHSDFGYPCNGTPIT